MGKTFRQPQHKYDDDQSVKKNKKHPAHTSGRKSGGMRIINDIYDENDDYFDDDVNIMDDIVINKYSDEDS